MKKFLVAVMFGLMAIAAQAEATFDQVQTLIEQREYQAAASGLEVIIQNHPKSAKAFYAMAQAQAGLGNQEKALKALNIATGLNPTLDFAPASSVASLKQAITPQVTKIEAIEESHFGRNIVLLGMFILFAVAMYFLYSVYARKRDEDQAEILAKQKEHEEAMERVRTRMAEEREKDRKATASGYIPPAKPAYRGPTQSVAPTPTPAPAPTYTAPSHTTVVNNNSGSNDLLTGVILGNMMSGSHHDTTRIVEREVIREAPAKSSTWDDTPAPTRETKSSTWDDTPSKPSRSSSWDDDSSSSSSKSSSSWSDNSSSSSSSSSSWDSGSSSSSDSGSSSSWD